MSNDKHSETSSSPESQAERSHSMTLLRGDLIHAFEVIGQQEDEINLFEAFQRPSDSTLTGAKKRAEAIWLEGSRATHNRRAGRLVSASLKPRIL